MVQRLPRRPVNLPIKPVELAQRYRDGASLDDLAILCGGCTAYRVRRILVGQGVEIRPRGYTPGQGKANKFLRR
jgi:hypothetical protein